MSGLRRLESEAKNENPSASVRLTEGAYRRRRQHMRPALCQLS